MNADQHTPAIVPPGDAPLPWDTEEYAIYDANGHFVGEFDDGKAAAYAAAAANALPGLVEDARLAEATNEDYAAMVSEVADIARRIGIAADPGWVRGKLEELVSRHRRWNAALAALPGEVRG